MNNSDANASSRFGSGTALALFAVIIWGAQFPIAKSAFEQVDAYSSGLFRYGIAAFVLLGLLWLKEGLQALRPGHRVRRLWLVSIVGMCGSPSLVFGGLMLTRPEIAAIIIAVQPALMAVVLWLAQGKRPPWFSLACIVFAFFGVVTVVTRWSLVAAPSGSELVGSIMILCGALCWVSYTLAGGFFRDWSALRFTTLTILMGTVGHFVLVFVLTATALITTPSWQQWTIVLPELLYLALLGVLLAMMTWNAGAKRIGPLNAMLFINLVPVLTFVVRYWQGYRFHQMELIGAAMVIFALIANNIALRLSLNRS